MSVQLDPCGVAVYAICTSPFVFLYTATTMLLTGLQSTDSIASTPYVAPLTAIPTVGHAAAIADAFDRLGDVATTPAVEITTNR